MLGPNFSPTDGLDMFSGSVLCANICLPRPVSCAAAVLHGSLADSGLQVCSLNFLAPPNLPVSLRGSGGCLGVGVAVAAAGC